MLLLASIVKAICEVLALTMLGQGLLWLIAGSARENNFVYKLFSAVTRPVMRLARLLMPRFVLDRYIWMVAVLLVVVLWVVSGHQKLRLCPTEESASPLCADIVRAVKERRSGS